MWVNVTNVATFVFFAVVRNALLIAAVNVGIYVKIKLETISVLAIMVQIIANSPTTHTIDSPPIAFRERYCESHRIEEMQLPLYRHEDMTHLMPAPRICRPCIDDRALYRDRSRKSE